MSGLSSDLNVDAGAFAPVNGPNASTVAIAATAASQTVALPVQAGGGNYGTQAVPVPGGGSSTFCVDNTSATAGFYVFVSFGQTAALAAATIGAGATPGSYPCPPGKTILTVPGNPLFAGVVGSGAGPTNVYITPGNGKA